MTDSKLKQRRQFLNSAAATAAAIGLSAKAALLQAADTPAAPASGTDTDFQKWLAGIHGKYRQVYDAPEPNSGFALLWSYVFLMTGAQGYGVPESDRGVVVVLRHAAIPLAFNDALWAKYKMGEVFKINDPATKAPSTRNAFANIKPGDLPIPDAAVDKLIARGVKFGVCNMAITVYSGIVAKQMGLQHDEVKKDWIAGVFPGITVVPSGVVAVNGAQANGCTYCFAG